MHAGGCVGLGFVWRSAEILAHIRVTTLSPTSHTRCTDYDIPATYLLQYTTNKTSSFTVLRYYINIIATAFQSNMIERERTVGFVINVNICIYKPPGIFSPLALERDV